MDKKEQEILQNCHEYLIQNIRPLRLIDKLYSDKILTSDESEMLRKEATANGQNRLLLVDMLPKAGPNAFSSLMTALREADQSHVAERLLEELNKGMCMYVVARGCS